MLAGSGSTVALTGAGISVPSGIPDFRSPGTGLWEGVNPIEVAHIDAWRADPQRFWSFYGERFATLGSKEPNRAHEALARLEELGLVDAVITQNIDTLHRRAGSREVIEVHGTIEHSSCPQCGESIGLDEARGRIAAAGDGVPRCGQGHPLKPDVVLFGEMLPAAALARAQELAAGADLMLCIGSSLEVYPVAGLPAVTIEAGGQVVLVTQGPTPLDGEAALRLGGDVVDEMEALLRALG